jgi:molybdenum cofactor cytidylyltransferase
MISAIILAAGESRRMGVKNKLLLPISGEVLIRNFVKSVCASNVDEVVVVVGHEAEKIEDVLQGQPVRFVENLRYMEGMTSSIQTGIQAASAESEGLLICLADQPFIETSDFNRLIHEFTDLFDSESSLIIVPVFKGQRGNPVLFSSQFRDIILQHKDEGCRDIVLKHPECVREVEMGNDNVLQDVDTLEDYKMFCTD